MALFSKNKKEKEEKKVAAEVSEAPRASAVEVSGDGEATKASTTRKHAGAILMAPRITEKGAYIAERGVYVFNVAPSANKREIAEAIRDIYKVMPAKVRVASIPRTLSVSRTRGGFNRGMTAGGKKAYVYLKKGDTIEIA